MLYYLYSLNGQTRDIYLAELDQPEVVSNRLLIGGVLLPEQYPLFAAVGPSWAPDSQWFTYASRADGYAEIDIANVGDSSHPRRLTAASGENFNPQWQPSP